MVTGAVSVKDDVVEVKEHAEDTMDVLVESFEGILVNESHGNFMPMFVVQSSDQIEFF